MNRFDLWSWDGKIDRGTYALVGLVGFAVKHNLDRVVAARVFHRPWSLFNYWITLDRAVRINSLGSSDRAFLFWMLMLSLPFVWVGVALTLRRLRAMGVPLWLLGLLLLALAVEGVICLLMAAPIGLLLGLLGGTVGYYIQRRRWSHFENTGHLGRHAAVRPAMVGRRRPEARAAAPFGSEHSGRNPCSARHSVALPFLVSRAASTDGVALSRGNCLPVALDAGRLGGRSAPRVRVLDRCSIEPIRVWEPNHKLRFEISGEPPVMQEMSPCGHIHTRHIDGIFPGPRRRVRADTASQRAHVIDRYFAL
jgi:hypothetical protein